VSGAISASDGMPADVQVQHSWQVLAWPPSLPYRQQSKPRVWSLSTVCDTHEFLSPTIPFPVEIEPSHDPYSNADLASVPVVCILKMVQQ